MPSIMLLTVIIFVMVACSNEKSNLPKDSQQGYSFFVAGHTYGTPGVDNAGFHPPFKKKFDLIKNDEKIKFGILTGDIVREATVSNWEEIDADIEDIGKPVYIAPGNHDLQNRDLFEARYGPTYYSFLYNSDLFIVLDPNLDGWNISGDQLYFLKNELNFKAKTSRNIFVFFHQLLWWGRENFYRKITPNSGAGRKKTINFWTHIEPLFSNLPNQVYMFSGDVGAWPNGSEFSYHKYANITLIASGMGGAERDNFVIVDVRGNKQVKFRLIALNGENINALGKLEDFSFD